MALSRNRSYLLLAEYSGLLVYGARLLDPRSMGRRAQNDFTANSAGASSRKGAELRRGQGIGGSGVALVRDDVGHGLGEVLGRERGTELVLKGFDAEAGAFA